LPTLGEIIAGLEASTSREQSWDIAHRTLSRLVFWPFDEEAAYAYGRVFADLRRSGRIIQQVDMQIAVIALTQPNCVLVTYDSDLQAVSGITIEDWSTG